MCELFYFENPYDALSNEQSKFADNINASIPFSIPDNSIGIEKRQFMNKKRLTSKDDINQNNLEDVNCETQKYLELNEEEEEMNNSEKIYEFMNTIKKNKKGVSFNNMPKKYSNEMLDLKKTKNSKKVYIFNENENENEKSKTDKQKLPIILKNKEDTQGNKCTILNGETNAHTGEPNPPNNPKDNTNNPEIPEKKVLNTNLENLASKNKALNSNIKEKDKKIESSENNTEQFLQSSEEKLKEILEEKQYNDSVQDEEDIEDIEDNYDNNYDPQSILPSHSNELGNNDDEFLNISLSDVETNKKQYKCEDNQDDDCDDQLN